MVKTALCQWSCNNFLVKDSKACGSGWHQKSISLCMVSLDKHGKHPTSFEWSNCTFSWSAVLIGSPHPEVNSGSSAKIQEYKLNGVSMCIKQLIVCSEAQSVCVCVCIQFYVNKPQHRLDTNKPGVLKHISRLPAKHMAERGKWHPTCNGNSLLSI